MGYVEEKLAELYSLQPQAKAPDNLAEFWKKQLARQQLLPLKERAVLRPFASPYAKVFDISFDGCDGSRIHGWFLVPTFVLEQPLPCVIHFHGFTGDRGNPADFMAYLMMGCCVLSCDCRAQSGQTGDQHSYETGLIENVCMQGVLDPEDYYFKFLYMDAVRALDFACSRSEVDKTRIVLEGGSQGGALSLAVAALDERPHGVLCDVPSNCEIQKRIENGYGSFRAVRSYLQRYPHHADRVFETISYFDLANLSKWIQCPVFASVGLLDDVCPARYFFSAYNQIPSSKEVCVYPFNRHEGGGALHFEKKLNVLRTWICEKDGA